MGLVGVNPSAEGAEHEAALLRRVRLGDRDAYAELVAAHWPEAVRFATHLVGWGDAEDLVVDVFERLRAALDKGLGPTAGVRPYLFRMLRNAAIDRHRRKHDLAVDPATIEEQAQVDDHTAILESGLVRAAFTSLPQRWQQVLWLSYVEQQDRTEVANELGVRPGAVSQLALRAREGFRVAYLTEYARFARDAQGEHPTDVLPDYVAGKAAQDQADLVEEHLHDCAPCSDAVIEMRAMTKGLRVALLLVIGPIMGGLGWTFATAGASVGGARSVRTGGRTIVLSVSAVAMVAGLAFGADYYRRETASDLAQASMVPGVTEVRRPTPPLSVRPAGSPGVGAASPQTDLVTTAPVVSTRPIVHPPRPRPAPPPRETHRPTVTPRPPAPTWTQPVTPAPSPTATTPSPTPALTPSPTLSPTPGPTSTPTLSPIPTSPPTWWPSPTWWPWPR